MIFISCADIWGRWYKAWWKDRQRGVEKSCFEASFSFEEHDASVSKVSLSLSDACVRVHWHRQSFKELIPNSYIITRSHYSGNQTTSFYWYHPVDVFTTALLYLVCVEWQNKPVNINKIVQKLITSAFFPESMGCWY